MTKRNIKDQYLDDAVATQYDRDRFSSFVGRTFNRLEKRTLRSVVTRAKRELPNPAVLDIPCGTGRITELLLEEGLTVTGGDISAAMIDVARRRLARFGAQVSFRQLDLDRLAMEDDSVDLVTCIRLLHHIDSPARARILRECARVTRRFVIINVSYSSPLYRLRRRLKQAMGQGVSAASSTWTEIEQEAESAGLRIETAQFVFPVVTEDLVLLLRKKK
jgi:ubiquinone/menaquinone biosynthesis C-methylase UbiE